MKKLLIAAVASTAFISTGAFAAGPVDTVAFDVNGTVEDQCHIQDPADVNFGVIQLEDGGVPGTDSLTLNNGSQLGSNQNIWISCNYATTLKVESLNDGLFNSLGSTDVANDPNDFTDKIHYRVEITHANLPSLQLATNLGGDSTTVTGPGAFHDNASMKVYIDADGTPKRPVAGDYTDTVTLTLGAV